MQDTNTLGTPYRNARATMTYVSRLLASGRAPVVEPSPCPGALVVGWAERFDLDSIELGERAWLTLDGWICDGLKPCETCRNGGSHS